MYREFDYSLDFKKLDFRKHPEMYRIGRGEQGVLLIEPYKSEILPYWQFKTPALARKSASQIYKLYRQYKTDSDFVGMDMARKYLQMGFTRARRYSNHKSGRKYSAASGELLPASVDESKAEAAAIFKSSWDQVRQDPDYKRLRKLHRQTYEEK